ncbi:hypothetical protein FGG08_000905 [Glutinoglossum americanum]|uniref:Sterol regulatory element-binding protein cleavage-activating protein n=1 Tax=Glutinoglossum americanum TaxID=1670608 RepID=A0A9P8L5S6_9PEZI|nr:hypothetical protein FGG08_000905 [Glutinoglossum americanum]
MRAAEPAVLTEALHVQEALLGSTSSCEYLRSVGDTTAIPREWTISDSASTPASFFHSPLLYWNCSVAAIEADHDILETINERSRQVSSVNLTLRHSTVFAGKIFSKDRLVAADALVITFFHQIDPEIEELWNTRAGELAKDAEGRLTLYPANGQISRSHLYEFRFEPMSLREDILLGIAYALMVLYIAVNLRRLRAVKSKLGLVVTVIAQIGISIFSSFTICALLKIDLSQIPRELYPFVVLAMGIENMFQLINAVLMIPPETPTVSRISSALGNIGHLALARAAQNLLILWLLSKVVWVTAFCVFSSIALVFDFFFHLTFFLAVLSVDVRRMDLQDSLDRVNLAQGNSRAAEAGKRKWMGALLQGRIPFGTRVAGTAIMICFVTILNWHFFDNESPAQSFSRLMNKFRLNRASEAQTTLTMTVNQARSPTSWLRLQDHDTAKEVIRIVKPHAHSFVAQVYDPLVFVTKGANRDQSGGMRTALPYRFLPVIPDAIREHLLPFGLLFAFAIAVVTLLMNYLLWDEAPDDITGIPDGTEPTLSIKTHSGVHTLDIIMLSASASGVLVSVGLDHQIIVWDLTKGWSRNVTEEFRSIEGGKPFWPVAALALDENSNWLAICSLSGLVSLLTLQPLSAAQPVDVGLDGRLLSAFLFTPERDTPSMKLLMVKADGWVIEIDPRTFNIFKQRSCHGKIIAACAVLAPKAPFKVVTATEVGFICSIVRSANGWEGDKFDVADQQQGDDKSLLPLNGILSLPALGLLLVIGHREVMLFDPQLGVVIHKFKTSQVKANSLRAIHSRRRQYSACGTGYGVSSFSILYTERETHNFTMHTYTPHDKQKNLICLHTTENSAESKCQSFASATQTLHQMRGAGIWEATNTNCAIGVRRKAPTHCRDYSTLHASPRSQLLRRGTRERGTVKSVEGEYDWEAWTMSARGDVNTRPIPNESANSELFVCKAGPICRVGECSVVVGFGNSIKLLVAGNERFDSRESGSGDFSLAAVGYRKRIQTRRSQ